MSSQPIQVTPENVMALVTAVTPPPEGKEQIAVYGEAMLRYMDQQTPEFCTMFADEVAIIASNNLQVGYLVGAGLLPKAEVPDYISAIMSKKEDNNA